MAARRYPGHAARASMIAVLTASAICALPLAIAAFARGSFRTGAAAAGVFAALIAGGYRLSPAARFMAALCLCATAAATYAAEFTLSILHSHPRAIAAVAKRLGRVYDGRTVRQIVDEYRARGVEAYPCCIALTNYLEYPPAPAPGFVPLAAPSRTFHVMCNESGSYVTFESDEHGFHNPPGLWDARGTQIAVIGDSFTQGFCVAGGAAFVDQLRKRYPLTVNLGIRGSGPLTHLAVLKEYAAALRPRAVVWAFFENDLEDLEDERRIPVLERYLQSGYRQGLIDRQEEIDRWAAAVLSRASQQGTRRQTLEDFLARVSLTELRSSVANGALIRSTAPRQESFDLFKQILAEGQRTTRGWGGALYIAYLPGLPHFAGTPKTPAAKILHAKVLEIAGGLGIPVIDLLPPLAESGNAETLFFYPGSHYTEMGYKTVAEHIWADIEATHP